MKKFFVFLIVVLLIAGATACAPSPERMIEQMLEQAIRQEGQFADFESEKDAFTFRDEDEQVTVEADNDTWTVTSEGGQATLKTGDGMQWPDDKLPANVPPIPGVNVELVMDMGTGIVVSFSGCDQPTAAAYVATLKSLGWKSIMDMESEDGHVNIFENNNASLSFTWSKDDGAGSITYGQN